MGITSVFVCTVFTGDTNADIHFHSAVPSELQGSRVIHVLGSIADDVQITYALPIVTSIILPPTGQLLTSCGGAASKAAGRRFWAATQAQARTALARRLSWLVGSPGSMSAIATVPLLIAIPGLSFTDAFFETMSGLTPPARPCSWRRPPAALHQPLAPRAQLVRAWASIVLVWPVLPLLGVGVMQVYKAETAGPMKNDKAHAAHHPTARALWFVYFLITVACILSPPAGGMGWFDAVCHAFAPSLGASPPTTRAWATSTPRRSRRY